MAVRTILRMGHPVLAARARPVEDPTGPDIAALVEDMQDTMRAANGRGIAAPQIGESLRVVIFHAPLVDQSSRSLEDAPLTVLINPEIEIVDPATDEDWEGCLSVPGLAGKVPRPRHIRYCGLGLDGARLEREARDFHARVVLHECDHLDGMLYPRRMTDLATLRFTTEPVED